MKISISWNQVLCARNYSRTFFFIGDVYRSKLDKAEELYSVLLKQTSDKIDRARYYYWPDSVKDDEGDYQIAAY